LVSNETGFRSRGVGTRTGGFRAGFFGGIRATTDGILPQPAGPLLDAPPAGTAPCFPPCCPLAGCICSPIPAVGRSQHLSARTRCCDRRHTEPSSVVSGATRDRRPPSVNPQGCDLLHPGGISGAARHRPCTGGKS